MNCTLHRDKCNRGIRVLLCNFVIRVCCALYSIFKYIYTLVHLCPCNKYMSRLCNITFFRSFFLTIILWFTFDILDELDVDYSLMYKINLFNCFGYLPQQWQSRFSIFRASLKYNFLFIENNRLKPLYPVKVDGPTMQHCRGVIAGKLFFLFLHRRPFYWRALFISTCITVGFSINCNINIGIKFVIEMMRVV